MNEVSGTQAPIEVEGPDLCYCLAGRRSARFLARIYETYLEPAGLTSSEFSILSILEHFPGITVAELARRMEMERTTLVRALRPLKDRAFVVDGDEKQRRAVILRIAPSGLKKLDDAKPHWEAAQEAFERKVGKMDAARFRGMAITTVSRQD
jgi:DNA-binding MarR family transcriptional regulator